MQLGLSRITAATAFLGALWLPAPIDAQPASPPSAHWSDAIKFSGYIEAGITANPDDPSNGLNFGHLFTDRANTPLLNQASMIIERPLGRGATDYDFGFKFQPLYGSDARYIHFLGEMDRATSGRNQWDVLEADLRGHFPWLTEGGVDAMLGQFPTLLGAEAIPPAGNPLYSHSYIFNFGAPFKHTGLWTITHANDIVDVYLGIDTGNQTTLGRDGDNNGALSGLGGFGLTLLGGKLTIIALSHLGPENPRGARDLAGHPIAVNRAFRYYNTVTTTYRWSDDLTLTTDLNFVRDDGAKADGYGIAQYAAYVLSDWATLEARGEIWRDSQGFFVAAFPGSLDAANALAGRANRAFNFGSATYGEITLGVNVQPPVPKLFKGAVLRPELRYDATLNGAKPFNLGKSGHQITIAADMILPF